MVLVLNDSLLLTENHDNIWRIIRNLSRAFTPSPSLAFPLHSKTSYLPLHLLENVLRAYALWNSFLKTLQKTPFIFTGNINMISWTSVCNYKREGLLQICHSDLLCIPSFAVMDLVFVFSYVMTLRCHKNQGNFTTFTTATAVATKSQPFVLSMPFHSICTSLHIITSDNWLLMLPFLTMDYLCYNSPWKWYY